MHRLSGQIGSPQAPCFVHVTGTRPGRTVEFVEFEFIVGDTDLSIEMVMPREAFDEFCRRYAAKPLAPERHRRIEAERKEWLYGASDSSDKPPVET